MSRNPSRRARRCRQRRVVVVARAHVGAADQDAADARSGDRGAVVVGDAHLAVLHRRDRGARARRRLRSLAGHRRARVAGPSASRASVSVRSGAPGSGNVTARLASARPYTGNITLGASRAGASAATNSRQRSAAIGSAPLKITRTRDRSSAAARSGSCDPQVMHVAEIGRARHGDAMLARLRDPQPGPPHEQRRRHEPVIDVFEQRRQVEADQPHVVRERHPRQARVVVARAHALAQSRRCSWRGCDA